MIKTTLYYVHLSKDGFITWDIYFDTKYDADAFERSAVLPDGYSFIRSEKTEVKMDAYEKETLWRKIDSNEKFTEEEKKIYKKCGVTIN
jgi:hypothetical protein